MGLDLGKRRVGIAISDELGITGQPLPPLKITGTCDLMNQLDPLVRGHSISMFVLGRPVNLDGSPDHLTAWVEMVKIKLEGRFKLPVQFYDERFSSKMAQQAIHLSGESLRKNKDKLDSISASIILNDFLRANAGKNHI